MSVLEAAVPSQDAQELGHWTETECANLRSRFSELHRHWCAAWLEGSQLPQDDPDIEILTPFDSVIPDSPDVARWALDSGAGASVDPVDVLASTLFGLTQAGASLNAERSIARQASEAAWGDWLAHIESALGGFPLDRWPGPTEAACDAPAHAWSGALCVQWWWCGSRWSLVLPQAAVRTMLGPRSVLPPSVAPGRPLQSIGQALGSAVLGLRVELDGTRIDLGQLQTLRVGDVVPIRHSIDAPACVVGDGGQTVCHAWLGQSRGRLAIELAR